MKTGIRVLIAMVCLLACSAAAQGQYIVRVEEDWELHVIQPDPMIDAPQISTMMLPFGSDSSILFQVDLNHASLPTFSRGGMQVRVCDDDYVIESERILSNVLLCNDAETVSWTQVLAKKNDHSGYIFGVTNGHSATLGAFGGADCFVGISNSQAGSFTLDLYHHEHSLANSCVTFASNRVGWLRLKKVRVYFTSGQVIENSMNLDVN